MSKSAKPNQKKKRAVGTTETSKPSAPEPSPGPTPPPRPRWDPFKRIPLAVFFVGLLLIVLVASRFYNLGDHGFHHDESIHCLHSWNIVNTTTGPSIYRYDPVYHGPFLYHWGALFHFFGQKEAPEGSSEDDRFYHHLLPDSDAVGRAPYATVGVFLVAVFLLLGPRLGWGTVLLIAGFLTFSPTIDYFSRFARNDVYQIGWLAGMIVTGTLYLQTRKTRYLIPTAFFLALSYCTKENSYVNNFSLCSFLVGWGLWRIVVGRKKGLREVFVDYLPLTRLLILYGCFSVFVFSYVAIDTRISPETGLSAGISKIISHSSSFTEKKDASAFKGESGFFTAKDRQEVQAKYFRLAIGTTWLLLLLAEILSFWFERESRGKREKNWALRFLALGSVAFLFYGLLASRLVSLGEWVTLSSAERAEWSPYGLEFLANLFRETAEEGKPYRMSAADFLQLTGLKLFLDGALLCVAATMFLIPDLIFRKGESEASPGLSAYKQQKQRLFGLWALAFQLAIVCGIYILLFSSLGTHVSSLKSGLYNYLGYWFKHQTGDYRIWGAWWYYIPRLALYEILPILVIGFMLALIAWQRLLALAVWLRQLVIKEGGETETETGMPPTPSEAHNLQSPNVSPSRYWKPVPIPLLFFSGYFAVFMFGIYAFLNEKVSWLVTYQSFAFSLFAALLVGHYLATRPNAPGPVVGRIWDLFSPPTLAAGPTQLKGLLRWCGIVILRTSTLLALAFLICFTLWQHRETVFRRPDQPTELLVYTGTTHDFAEHARRIRGMAEEAEEKGEPFKICVEGQAQWPSTWYFRNQKVTWNRLDLSGDVQITDNKPANRNRIRRGAEHVWETNPCFLRAWWIWHGTPDALPGKLSFSANLKSLLANGNNDRHRYFPAELAPDRQEYETKFRNQLLNYVFFREVWYPVGGEKILVCYKTKRRIPPTEKEVFLKGSNRPAVTWASERSFGAKGSGPLQFDQPRGIAITPDGKLAIADSKNGRIQVVSATGEFLFEFGKGILSPEVSGVSDVVCDSDGIFYVADTWNHNVRKFSAKGELIGTGQMAKRGQETERMFGPRGIDIDSAGRVFTTDTGNSAVRVFDKDLKPLFSWGSKGRGPGQFHEPVGIAIDGQDRVYVADTGNGRIQQFDSEGNHLISFIVEEPGPNQIVTFEPHLAVLDGDRLVVAFPEKNTVWLISPDRKLAQVRQVKNPPMQNPLGIVADREGYVWIGDRLTSIIVRVKAP